MTSARSLPARLGPLPGLALVLLGALIALGTLAAAWAPALGDGRHEACTSRGVPYSPPYESWRVEVAVSALPIGVTCTWTDPDTGHVVRQEPSWGPTVAAGIGAAFGCGWLAAAGWVRILRGAGGT
ncbi:hypothetical protein [Blastococcus saxobsidens]|nr:hypothetical protein [Blastococcus saxobsidens]